VNGPSRTYGSVLTHELEIAPRRIRMNGQLLTKNGGSAPHPERLDQDFEERRAGELAPKKAKLKLAGRGSGRHRDRIRGERLGAGIGARSWKGGRHDGWCRYSSGSVGRPASRALGKSCSRRRRCARRSVGRTATTTGRSSAAARGQNRAVRKRRTQLGISANDKPINRGPRTSDDPFAEEAEERRRHGISETASAKAPIGSEARVCCRYGAAAHGRSGHWEAAPRPPSNVPIPSRSPNCNCTKLTGTTTGPRVTMIHRSAFPDKHTTRAYACTSILRCERPRH
jgi:hypothetical protein